MSDGDKPFECPEHGCGMRFTNEDHLSVHMRKHDLSLALNLGGGGFGLSPMSLYTDQTPTPTKFLKNCEEIGLFQELNANKHINPFDDSFKKALEPGEEGDLLTPDIHILIPGPVPNDLDTPVPLTIPKSFVDIPTDDDNKTTGTSSPSLSSILPKKRKKYLSQSLPTSTTSDNEDDVVSASTSSPGVVSLPDIQEEIPSVTMVTSSTTMEQKREQSAVMLSPQYTATTDGPMPTVAQTTGLTMQLVLQLPDGQSIQIPVPADLVNNQHTLLQPMEQHVQVPQFQGHQVQIPQVQGQQIQGQQIHGQQIQGQSIQVSSIQGLQFQSPPQGQYIQRVPKIETIPHIQGQQIQGQPIDIQQIQGLAQGQNIQGVQKIGTIPHIQGQTITPARQIKTIPFMQNIPTVLPANSMSSASTIPTVPINLIHTNNITAVPNAPRTLQHGNLPMNVPVNFASKIFSMTPSPLTQTGAQTVTAQHSAAQSAVRIISPENQTVSSLVQNTVVPGLIVAGQNSPTPADMRSPSPKRQIAIKSLKLPTMVHGSQSYTKMKLKEALQQQTSPASTVKINQIFSMIDESPPADRPLTIVDSPSMVSNSDSASSPDDSMIPFKQFKFDDSMDELDDKRQKFLERNRAAAARCRQKRKSWVGSLEKKSEDLINVNNRLQNEVKLLRGEVAELKCLLMAHKDCPVTLQQQSQLAAAENMIKLQQQQSQKAAAEKTLVPRAIPNVVIVKPETQTSVNPETAVINVTPHTVNGSVPQAVIAGLPQAVIAGVPQNILSAVPHTVLTGIPQSVTPRLQPNANRTVISPGVTQTVVSGVPQTIMVPQSAFTAAPQTIVAGLPQTVSVSGTNILASDIEAETQEIFTSVLTGPNSLRLIPALMNGNIMMTGYRS